MVTGFNTDVEYNGRIYHVQTEDKGASNPVIESLIYVGGEILASRKTPYSDLLQAGSRGEALSERVEAQHQRMIMDIRQGKYDPEGVQPFGAGIISDRGFEEVVLEYLASELGSEALQIAVDSPSEFTEGEAVDLVLRARGELSARPVLGVAVAVRLLTPLDKPRTLAEGKTDEKGTLHLPLTIPAVEGDAAVLLQATLGEESVDLQWFVKRSTATA